MKVIMIVMFSIATVSLLLFILILIKVLSNEHCKFILNLINISTNHIVKFSRMRIKDGKPLLAFC